MKVSNCGYHFRSNLFLREVIVARLLFVTKIKSMVNLINTSFVVTNVVFPSTSRFTSFTNVHFRSIITRNDKAFLSFRFQLIISFLLSSVNPSKERAYRAAAREIFVKYSDSEYLSEYLIM